MKFAQGPFLVEARRRVEQHLARIGSTGRDDPRQYLKAALILGWFFTSYALLLFVASSWWTAAMLSVSLGLAMAGIGFNLMHDGGHGAYSRFPLVNRVMALSLELLGGSSYVWKWKHNVIHHIHPNLGGIDDDLEVGPWARMARHQPRRWIHRYQQFYMWALFGLLPFKWYLLDIRNFRRGAIGEQRFPRDNPTERAIFIAGKLLLPLWALALPMIWHSPWVVLLVYFTSFFTTGVVLSVTFLLAHCVEDAQCPALPPSGRVEIEWGAHQVQTAVDFSPNNRLLSWYVGGLNCQIEHHLFPQLSHVHYPAIARLIRELCAELGVRYVVHPTLSRALRAHFRWLRLMGAPVAGPGAAPAGLAA